MKPSHMQRAAWLALGLDTDGRPSKKQRRQLSAFHGDH